MKLITEIVNKGLELSNEMELKHEYVKYIWHFYKVYNVCIVLTGMEDKEVKKKNSLIRKLINKFDFRTYAKLRAYMKTDYAVINKALGMLEEYKEDSDFYGDYDLPDMIAISQYD